MADGLVRSEVDPADRRVRRLTLSDTGARLEAEPTGEQRRLMEAVFREAGPEAESGWRRVMALLAASAVTPSGPSGSERVEERRGS